MNIKRFTLFILIFLCLILCVSAVSAQNSTAADDAQEKVTTDNTQTKDPVKKVDTDADDVVVAYKKKAFLKVKVKDDDTKKPIKNLKLKVKVSKKSKSKTYTIKTNSKGIAKFNTKKLGLGDYKVVITSADDKYKVKEKAHIFVGKKHTITLKPNTHKKLKNKDILRVYTKNDDDEKELKVSFKPSAKKTNIIKAIFYFKNKATGKLIKKIDFTEFEHGKWDYPDEDYSNRYVAIKVKIAYVTIK